MKFITKCTPVINNIAKVGTKCYSSTAVKPNIKLIAQIRQKTEISISKAKEALVATNNDLDAALEWIQTNLAEAGAKKGAKLAGRVASEGLVGVATLNDLAEGTSKGALVELCCETDFVSRNDNFHELVQSIAKTVLTLQPEQATNDTLLSLSPELVQEALIEGDITVKQKINETIGKLGENIILRRTILTNLPKSESAKYFTAGFAHGGAESGGKIGGLVVLKAEGSGEKDILPKLGRQLARQVVGFNPQCLTESDSVAVAKKSELSATEYEEFLASAVLLNQSFIFGSESVGNTLKQYVDTHQLNLSIETFSRLEAGEGIEKVEDNFAEEVMKQANI